MYGGLWRYLHRCSSCLRRKSPRLVYVTVRSCSPLGHRAYFRSPQYYGLIDIQYGLMERMAEACLFPNKTPISPETVTKYETIKTIQRDTGPWNHVQAMLGGGDFCLRVSS